MYSLAGNWQAGRSGSGADGFRASRFLTENRPVFLHLLSLSDNFWMPVHCLRKRPSKYLAFRDNSVRKKYF